MADVFTPEGAREAEELLARWPDAAERADPRKTDAYWDYVTRKRAAFDGTFAFGVAGRFVTVTLGADGAATVRVSDEATALASAKLAVVADAGDWAEIVAGYDIGKAMTYHQLPLRVGTSTLMLRNAYLVHEILTVFTRVAGLPAPAPA